MELGWAVVLVASIVIAILAYWALISGRLDRWVKALGWRTRPGAPAGPDDEERWNRPRRQ